MEATNPDGSKRVVLKTTDPGFATADAMQKLQAWYKTDKETLPLIKAAVFVYDFLSIHPFQDGNGRLSRLLGTLLLLKAEYIWIQYVSFEHEIESRKAAYYQVLMQCQRNRPRSIHHGQPSFDCLMNIQIQLETKLEVQKKIEGLSLREKNVIREKKSPGTKSAP